MRERERENKRESKRKGIKRYRGIECDRLTEPRIDIKRVAKGCELKKNKTLFRTSPHMYKTNLSY